MDIKVNDAEWAALGKDEQQRIESIVKGFFKGAMIVPDAATPASGVPKVGVSSKDFCEAACGIAQETATVVCYALGNPIAIAACVAAVKTAGDLCRRQC